MRVLALDTTRRDGSVALVDGSRVAAERRGDPQRTHAERLPGEILALLDESDTRLADIELFAVASGPGSFTGLRVGIATIQGLAFVHRRRVVAVSALEALAHAANPRAAAGSIVGAWMDAQRHEVFTALYRRAAAPSFDSARLIELESPAVRDPLEALNAWRPIVGEAPMTFLGDGAGRYGDLIRARWPDAVILEPPLLAGTIGLIAQSLAASGRSVDPAAVRPLYVRRPDAEIDRERRACAAAEAKDSSV